MSIERISNASPTRAADDLVGLIQAILEPGCFALIALMLLSFVFALNHSEQFAELASLL